jgi:hypothetical protein
MTNSFSRLHQSIVSCYDLEDLRTLCFTLDVEYDDLRGETRSDKARELIRYMRRQGRLDELLEQILKDCPNQSSQLELDAEDLRTPRVLYVEWSIWESFRPLPLSFLGLVVVLIVATLAVVNPFDSKPIDTLIPSLTDTPMPTLEPTATLAPVFLYIDQGVGDDTYSPDGWMGDAVHGRVSFDPSWEQNPYSGQTCIRIEYTFQVEGWAIIYWLYPENNWGDNRAGGLDLTGADRLTFWARSDEPDAKITVLIGGIGYPPMDGGNDCSNPSAPYPDSVCPKITVTEPLSTHWRKYEIDLHQYNPDLSHVVGGFGWYAEDKVIIYLDDIVYEFD